MSRGIFIILHWDRRTGRGREINECKAKQRKTGVGHVTYRQRRVTSPQRLKQSMK
jgi:hypothetical protein